MKLLYFAWLRQKIGIGEEEIDLPAEITDVGGLVAWLKSRGPGHAEAFANMKVVRTAVNQEYVPLDTLIAADDEIAFFPPMTGG